MLRSETDTIFALSSGQGRAGVAVVRISGPLSRFVVETIGGGSVPTRVATLRELKTRDGRLIDRGLVLSFAGPSSFTGEDCAEFQVHGGRAVVQLLLATLGEVEGCRLARRGEFAERALRNGKIDLLGVEALADLIDAETEAQRALAISGQSGRLRAAVLGLRQGLLTALALIEAGIDFSDEGDVPDELDAQAKAEIAGVRQQILSILAQSRSAERLRCGLKVVLAGAVNTGKSTLLNALAGREAAIVSAQPGTTRDQIDVHLDLGGWPITISDTAGLRETGDEVERIGIGRTHEAVRAADLVLHLAASDQGWEGLEVETEAEVLLVRSKIDSYPIRILDPKIAAISARTGEGMDELLGMIESTASRLMRQGDGPVVTHERQRIALESALSPLERAGSLPILDAELVSVEIRAAARSLSELIGDLESEVVLGEIFGRFCIGK